MSLPKHLNQKATVLFVLLFFTSNLILGQSFFNNYGVPNQVSDLDISATNAGFSLEILLRDFQNDTEENYNITTDANGNLISSTDYPGLGSNSPFPAFIRLTNGNFLKQPGIGTNTLLYEIVSPNGQVINSFTLDTPTGTTAPGARGKIGEYANGDLLLPYFYFTATGSDFGAARVNPTTGQVIWQTEVPFDYIFGVGNAGAIAIHENDDAFIMVDNFDAVAYDMIKLDGNGNLIWNNQWGGASKTPSDFVTTPDGGIWFRWNQSTPTIIKVASNGNQAISISTDPIFMAGTTREALVGTPDGGVIVAGRIGEEGDMWVLRLDANGGVVYANVLDNLPQETAKTTSAFLLNSGEVILGGIAEGGDAFLLKLNQDGEFDESGDGCNVSITSANGGVTITGLTSDANSKLFNSNTQPVWGCDPWQGSPCSGNETVSNLIVGATYFLSVESSECEEWIPIVIQGIVGCPDADSDGTCDVDDCEPNDPSLPTTPGSPCNDFNGNTTNDIIQSDGCTCQGTPIVSGCNVNITSSNGGVTITGLTSDANSKLFNPSIQPVWGCDPWQGSPCSGNETVSNLTVGATYFLSVESSECSEWIPIVIQGVVGCPDADNDGTCDVDDCAPNNPSLPATPGSPCNDFNGNTTNDIIQSDGCTCQGIPIVSGCNVNITSSNGGVTITGLTSDANSKLFNPSIQPVWGCDPWQGSPCSGNETVSNLTVGATYFLSVQSSECEEWIPIVIRGSGGTGIDLTAANFSSNSGEQGQVVDFTFDLINAGNQTATSSYDIRTYISIDNQLSVDDIREGNIVTGGTPPGTTPNVNGAFTVPDNLFPGDYFLILKVDDGNTVTETNENNNVFSTPITIFDDGIGECNNPVLVSQGKPATQSSTLNFGGINSGASNAVDGNTDGNYYNGSVAATTEENQAWWQVDLGGFYDVFSISAYNRTEGTARLNDFYIMASDTPFSSGNLVDARNNASYEIYIPGQANVPTQWFPNNNAPVRYVRVQRTGNGYLTLAELQVNGCPVANLQGSSTENFEATEELTTPYLNVGDLYPNPTSREVFSQIESAFAGEIFVQVVNILGQVNLEKKVQLEVGMNTLQLELEHCKAGIYHVIFHSKTKLISKQIVLSKL